MRRRTNSAGLFAACLILAATVWPLTGSAGSDFRKAQQLIEQGRIPEARRALSAELRIHPEHIEARYDLAVLLEDIGHDDEARNLYEQNLKRAWHLPSLINLAALLQRHGDRNAAMQWLKQATKRLQHEAAPWYLLAAMSEQQGLTDLALQQYQRAVGADPLNGFAWLYFAKFQSRHRLGDGGLRYAGKAIRLLSDCAPCWRKYGRIMQTAGRDSEALAAFQRSLAIRPDAVTRQLLIDTLHKLGRHERAARMQQALDAWRRHHKTQ